MKELSGDFSSFKMSKSSIKVPSSSEMRMIVEINKDLTFKPQLDKNSEIIDKLKMKSLQINK
jgi:hypothetical protein